MRRSLGVAGMVLALALVLVIVFSFPGNQARHIATLPDGARVEFLGTSMGSQVFTTEKSWHAWARRFLPPSMRSWLPNTVRMQCSSSSNSMTVFVTIHMPSNSLATVAGPPWHYYRAVDDDGFAHEIGRGYCSTTMPTGERVYGLSLKAFPRRQSSFQFQFLSDEDSTLGGIQVPNPVFPPFASWRSRPWPQVQTNGPVTLTLNSMKQRNDGSGPRLVPDWSLTSEDPAWSRARITLVSVQDVTGNEARYLSRREPVWKVVARVRRENPDSFRPHERVVVPNLSIPETATFTEIRRLFPRDAVTVTLQCVGGAGALIVSNRTDFAMSPSADRVDGHSVRSVGGHTIETWRSASPWLLLEASGLEQGDSLEFMATDANGDKVAIQDQGTYHNSKGGNSRRYFLKFKQVHAGQQITLDILIKRPLFFEFLVDPSEVPVTSASKAWPRRGRFGFSSL